MGPWPPLAGDATGVAATTRGNGSLPACPGSDNRSRRLIRSTDDMSPRAPWSALTLAIGIMVGGLFIGGGLAKAPAPPIAFRHREGCLGTGRARRSRHLADQDRRRRQRPRGSTGASAGMNIRGVPQASLPTRRSTQRSVSLQNFLVSDALANQYNSTRPVNRYVIHQTVVIRSDTPGPDSCGQPEGR